MTDISSSQKRPLPYPLTYTETIIGFSPDDGLSTIALNDIFPDEDTKIELKFELSLQEYVALASSIDVGRDIAYGSDSEWIWWIWVSALRGLAMSCEDVADCIETNETVQEAIRNQTITDNDQFGETNPDYLSPSGMASTTIINNRFPPAQRAEAPKDPPVDCNLDELWSGIYFMVQKMDERGRDWLEQIVARVDKWERVAEFLGTVPIVGEIAENIALSVIDVIPDILDLYNAYSTEERLQELACLIFSSVCAECRYPTFNEIMDFYVSPLPEDWSAWATMSVNLSMDYLFGASTLASIGAWYTVQAFSLFIMYTQSTFFNLRGTKWIGIWLDNGEEFANDEWEVLCDGCEPPEWIIEYDFTLSDGGWTVSDATPDRGVWVSGEGWKSTTASGTTGIIVQHAMPASCLVASGQMDYHFDGGSAQGRLRVNASGSGGTNIVQWGPTSTTPNSACGTPASPVNNTLLQFIADKATGTQNIWVTSVKLRGTGAKPTGYTSDTGVTMSCP